MDLNGLLVSLIRRKGDLIASAIGGGQECAGWGVHCDFLTERIESPCDLPQSRPFQSAWGFVLTGCLDQEPWFGERRTDRSTEVPGFCHQFCHI